MGKPSIFSKEYQRKMKRRKITISIIAISIAIFGLLFLVIGGGNLKEIKTSINKAFSKNDKKVEDTIKKPDEDVKPEIVEKDHEKETEENKPQEEKYYEVAMASGGKVKIIYDEVNGEKKILTVAQSNDYSSYDINPSQKSAILVDSKNQDLILIKENGEVNKITNPSYVSQSKGKTYSKESILAGSPNFLWGVNAKFIDDTHIAYLTNLPYFDENKNIWICDTATAVHKNIYGSKAKDISFNQIKDGALEIVIDSNIKYIKSDGVIIQR